MPHGRWRIVRDHDKTITVWRRENEIFLDELGRAETKIGEDKDVTLAMVAGSSYAAWVKDGQLILRHGGKQEVIASEAAFPNLAALPSGAFLTWETNNGISLKRMARRILPVLLASVAITMFSQVR